MKTPEEIRDEVNKCYLAIEAAKELIEKLRNECKHEKVHWGQYEWATGHIVNGNICDICDKYLDYLLNSAVVCNSWYIENGVKKCWLSQCPITNPGNTTGIGFPNIKCGMQSNSYEIPNR